MEDPQQARPWMQAHQQRAQRIERRAVAYAVPRKLARLGCAMDALGEHGARYLQQCHGHMDEQQGTEVLRGVLSLKKPMGADQVAFALAGTQAYVELDASTLSEQGVQLHMRLAPQDLHDMVLVASHLSTMSDEDIQGTFETSAQRALASQLASSLRVRPEMGTALRRMEEALAVREQEMAVVHHELSELGYEIDKRIQAAKKEQRARLGAHASSSPNHPSVEARARQRAALERERTRYTNDLLLMAKTSPTRDLVRWALDALESNLQERPVLKTPAVAQALEHASTLVSAGAPLEDVARSVRLLQGALGPRPAPSPSRPEGTQPTRRDRPTHEGTGRFEGDEVHKPAHAAPRREAQTRRHLSTRHTGVTRASTRDVSAEVTRPMELRPLLALDRSRAASIEAVRSDGADKDRTDSFAPVPPRLDPRHVVRTKAPTSPPLLPSVDVWMDLVFRRTHTRPEFLGPGQSAAGRLTERPIEFAQGRFMLLHRARAPIALVPSTPQLERLAGSRVEVMRSDAGEVLAKAAPELPSMAHWVSKARTSGREVRVLGDKQRVTGHLSVRPVDFREGPHAVVRTGPRSYALLPHHPQLEPFAGKRVELTTPGHGVAEPPKVSEAIPTLEQWLQRQRERSSSREVRTLPSMGFARGVVLDQNPIELKEGFFHVVRTRAKGDVVVPATSSVDAKRGQEVSVRMGRHHTLMVRDASKDTGRSM